MEPVVEGPQENVQQETSTVTQMIMSSGPVMLGFTLLTMYLVHKWIQRKKALTEEEDLDPEVRKARMLALQQAREKQQKEWQEASKKKQEELAEKEKRKRAEILEKLEKYGPGAGQKLGTSDNDYLPLSGGGSTSSYKPPKRSACSKGGCGK